MTMTIVTDWDARSTVAPSDVTLYLLSENWQVVERDDAWAVWTKIVEGERMTIRQPLEWIRDDYALRIDFMLQIMRFAEDRRELSILDSMSHISTDVHIVRIRPVDEAPEAISLDDGVRCYAAFRDLIAAAARSVDGRTPSSPRVLDHLRAVRIGPGGVGSLMLSAHTPVPPRFVDPEDPFARDVSLRVYEAAHAACRAADSTLSGGGEPDVAGIGVDFCEALIGLGGPAAHPVELELVLAVSRPADRDFEPVRFSQEHFTVLRAAVDALRPGPDGDARSDGQARSDVDGAVVVGHVVHAGDGEVAVVGTVGGAGTLRQVRVELAGDGHGTAMRAHREMRRISVRGDLRHRDGRWSLTGTSAPTILPT